MNKQTKAEEIKKYLEEIKEKKKQRYKEYLIQKELEEKEMTEPVKTGKPKLTREQCLAMIEEKRIRNVQILASLKTFDHSVLTSDDGWFPLPVVHLKKLPPLLPDFTKKLLKMLTPKIPESWFKGGIKTRIGTIISRMGYGKSETIKQIYKRVIAFYGEDKVNCIASMHIKPLVENFDDKPVQLLFLDDSAGLDKKDQKAMIKHIVRIRHTLKDAQKAREKKNIAGVIILVISSHSFFMLQKEIRTLFNFIIMKSYDSNAYNQRIMTDEFGKFAMKELERITKRKEVEDDMSVLNRSIISMIGEKKGGYIDLEYDPIEAEKECWRWIDFKQEPPMEYTSNKYHRQSIFDNDLDRFYDTLAQRASQDWKEINNSIESQNESDKENTNLFTSQDDCYKCIITWKLRKKDKLTYEQIAEKLYELGITKKVLGKRTVKQYISRANAMWDDHKMQTIQRDASEVWVVDELNNIETLFTFHRNCKSHSTGSTQEGDVCIHDENGNAQLFINVKWFIKKVDENYSFKGKITPEDQLSEKYEAPYGLLFIEGKEKPQVYFDILENDKVTRKKLTNIGEGNRVSILDAVVDEILKLDASNDPTLKTKKLK
ncbi:MAG: hypothetical protein ACTSPI_11885 [Candidatus Heimdallarchaeaceae archaeon]